MAAPSPDVVAGIPHLLVVDDDRETRDLLSMYFREQGFDVDTVKDGPDMDAWLAENSTDLVILDLMLPDADGFELARALRARSDLGIIMLTGRTDPVDRIVGLELGADDYVTKPFSPKVLAARVRAVLRRFPRERGPEEIKRGEFSMNFTKHETWFAGRPLNLTSVEFKLLGILAKEPGRVFSRANLIEEALGYDFEGFDRTIDVHILNLRRKLESDPSHPRYIKTVYGIGYKFAGGEH